MYSLPLLSMGDSLLSPFNNGIFWNLFTFLEPFGEVAAAISKLLGLHV